MSPINVAKFGGTSVANAAAMNNCAEVVLANPATRVVVLSASAGVTNLLVALAQGDLDEAGQEAQLARLTEIQQAILTELGDPGDLSDLIHGQLGEIRTMARQAHLHTDAELADRLIACGELMSTRLFTELLRQRGVKACWQDARQLLRTDSRFGKASVDLAATRALCQAALGPLLGDSLIITQGFIGADGDGRTTTLGRGGSDYSAALLAEALDAGTIEIWTDVPGIYTTDPRLVTRARPIPEISFVEAAEMATFGAKVLHPATLQPAVRQDIPVFVGSSKDPAAGGTWIRASTRTNPLFRAVALRRNQVLVTLHSLNMFHAYGFLAEVFGILARHRISVDLITTSEVSVSLTLDHTGSQSNGEPILGDKVLAELGQLCKVQVETGLALVALIGNRMSEAAGVGSQVFDAIREHNIRMICYGASAHNLCFLVKEDEAGHIVNRLHQELLD
ncbi:MULTISPECIES: lysine-sensitive aspartokinase 3 [Aeromonas]|uniref:Aspartokinase n=2 Tax=Aeromonas hydrophila TaxID=644 RepID=A0KLC9_AERHH|nr:MULTISPECIES: lysine-sensitive aspartokinase 3 [Aeromonas]ABK39678.1 asparate kinase, monofunctional class [Aeromonas hydrophila subsp. hydrophila ATCC 7966]MBS4672925.1 lysine-sensitive aspartokinase 3 [Aeromonas hydrophila]MBW3832919.1 lysine-sensitive aspartokinase 3 [Aeromonas hydrophila]MBW5265373.1 lysine-sensitive aspartokinase 3 [Aeromonas hydrophila]MBW5277956.1 lysine-sensitive aspartokinase 3 [Aeromonas hydrophila]